jgi:hypothetical protein
MIRMIRRFIVGCMAAVLLGGLSFSSAGAQTISGQDAAQALMLLPFQVEYQAAVGEAKSTLLHVTPPPANPDIWDVSAAEKRLVWNGEPGTGQVLVTTFTKGAYYSSYAPGQTFNAGADLWVVPAPEMYTEVKALNPVGASLTPRLATEQYLGLPPDSKTPNDTVVSLWVSPSNLVRPAIDPGVDSHELVTSFPVTMQSVPLTPAPTVPRDSPGPGQPATSSYASWFLEREASIFDTPGGSYPWTGLGYTYNWTPGAASVVGGSEYVIPHGSPVTLKDATPISTYYK